MADKNVVEISPVQVTGQIAGRLGLAATGTHGGNRDNRFSRFKHCFPRAGHHKTSTCGNCPRRQMHYVFMTDIAIGENDVINCPVAAELLEPVFLDNRYAVRIAGPGE